MYIPYARNIDLQGFPRGPQTPVMPTRRSEPSIANLCNTTYADKGPATTFMSTHTNDGIIIHSLLRSALIYLKAEHYNPGVLPKLCLIRRTLPHVCALSNKPYFKVNRTDSYEGGGKRGIQSASDAYDVTRVHMLR